MQAVKQDTFDYSVKYPLKPILSYDVIGFDMDHTLCRYKLGPLIKVCYDSFVLTMIEKMGYPEELKTQSEAEYEYSANNLVCDFETGCTLKLGANKQILRAFYGLKRLTRDEIYAKFGRPALYKVWDEDLIYRRDKYYIAFGFYDNFIAQIWAKAIEIREKHPVIKGKSFQQIYLDIHSSLEQNYFHYGDDFYTHPTKWGHFFPKLFANPMDYYFFTH